MLFYFPYKHQKNRVYKCKINDYTEIDILRNWVIAQNPDNNSSSHWWYSELPAHISLLYSKIASDKNIINMFSKNAKNMNIDIINNMNEIYVTAPQKVISTEVNNTSDKIFYTRHIDGPYFLFPFASCYRIILGLDDNSNVVTCFNMIPQDTVVKKGDVVAFDYHREPHYIYNKNKEITNNHRVILKIHYCIYPQWAYYFGKILSALSIQYNRGFRNLFLFTLKTEEKYKNNIAYLMILSTQIFHDIEYYIGYNNISFASMMYYIGYLTHYNIFLLGCLLIHYARKTIYVPENCKNVALKRDIKFYYVIYSFQIYYIYYTYLLFLQHTYYTNALLFIYIINDMKYIYELL
jgi:hypothetical protein